MLGLGALGTSHSAGTPDCTLLQRHLIIACAIAALSCRFYESKYPEVDDVVMVQVGRHCSKLNWGAEVQQRQQLVQQRSPGMLI